MKYSVTLTVPEGTDTSETALKKLAVQEIARMQKNAPHNKSGSRSQGTGARVTEKDISAFIFKKKSLDARRNSIKTVFRYDVYTDGDRPDDTDGKLRPWLQARQDRQVIIIGDGPAGLFAALRLLEDGIKPVIIERGPEASQRKRDIADISRTGSVHTDSNYCFGEGGAGTFSDGKLFSRSNKRGNIDKILQIFAFHGAQASITTDAHPHIGTDRLPAIIGAMNETIRSHGGEVHFNTRCLSLIMEDNRVKGVSCINTLNGSHSDFRGEAVILATGHSAPDMYEMIAAAHSSALEAKTFAAGVRVEHPREMIDRIQYHGRERGEQLPAAEYRLVTQVDGRGVYSFCMCPGGLVVPSASAPGGVVVNGMSPSSRNARWSNAAIVVELRPEDYAADCTPDEAALNPAGTRAETFTATAARPEGTYPQSTYATKNTPDQQERLSEGTRAAEDAYTADTTRKADARSEGLHPIQDALAGLRFRTQMEQAAYAACHHAFESKSAHKSDECLQSMYAADCTPDEAALNPAGTRAETFTATAARKADARSEGTYPQSTYATKNTPDQQERLSEGTRAAEDAYTSGTAGKAEARIRGSVPADGVNPQAAPAQRLTDFLEGRLSETLPESSYTPGLVSARLDLLLPEHISRRLRKAFRDFDRNMRGFICKEALLIAPETRTSTPVRILRDKETLESPVLKGLYPAGEGSGYAGGITSSAMDGEKAAAAVLERVFNIR